MKAALRLMGVATNEKEVNDLFNQMDVDNSGFIVLNEFVEVWAFLKSKQAGSANSASAQYYAPGDSYHPPGDMSMTMFFQPPKPWLKLQTPRLGASFRTPCDAPFKTA